MKIPTITLNNGETIPSIGIGPASVGYRPNKRRNNNIWFRAYSKFIQYPLDALSFERAVANSLRIGYTLLDNSASYNNDIHIKKAIKKSGISRSDIFITSRVSNQAQFSNTIRTEFFKTLQDLETDYIDLYQFHWPVNDLFLNTWREMIALSKEGYVRSIGVANCHKHHLDKMIDEFGVIPVVNQIEVHPLFSQKELISYCKSKEIIVQAYTPIARFDDRLMKLPILNQIALKYNKTIVQIVLRWHIQNGLIPIIRSLNYHRQRENIDVFDFKLSEHEMVLIDNININSRLRFDPDNCDFSIL